MTGDAGERNCIRGPQSVTGMSSTGARAREDSLILPTIRHPADPHARAVALMTEAVGLELVWRCVAGERREAAVHQIRDVDTGDAARMVDEWVRTLVGVLTTSAK